MVKDASFQHKPDSTAMIFDLKSDIFFRVTISLCYFMGCACVLEANSRAKERGLSLVHANKTHINLCIAPAWTCTVCVA